MAVTIPTIPAGTSTEITLRSSSTDLTPYLGGPTQRIARMGDRWLYKVECRPMKVVEAGAVIAALVSGLSEKVLCPIVQDGVDLSGYSNGAVVGAVTGGSTLTHSGGGATKYVGQFFSIVKSGVRYLHMVTGVSGSGNSVLTFRPMLKVPLAGGEVLEFGAPKIEGFVDGNEQTWTVGLVSNLGVTFQIVEAQ
jgi:hypothetical protein